VQTKEYRCKTKVNRSDS